MLQEHEHHQTCRSFSSQNSDYHAVTGSHDEHFLRRLDRLPTSQVELALGLYRDHELVKSLLNDLSVAESVQRVAISIRDPQRGPFIVVARNGHFVTCLGEGMRVTNIPVVTSEHFDRVARRVQRYRDMMAEIALHPQRELRRALHRILVCGSDVSREEFRAIATWQPLLAPAFLETFLRIAGDIHGTYSCLSRRQDKFKRKDEPELHRYWQETWAMAHLTLLLGVDGGHYLRSLNDSPDLQPLLSQLSWQTIRLNVISHGLRGAWLAAKIGKPLVSPAKQVYQAPESYVHLLDAGITLSSIGHAHRKLQSEVGKLLAKTERVAEGPNKELFRFMHRSLAAHYEIAVKEPEISRKLLDATADQVVDQLRRNCKKGLVNKVADEDRFRAAHRDLGKMVLFRLPHPIVDEGFASLPGLLLWLPSVVRMKAEEFYMPRKRIDRKRSSGSLESAIRLLEPRRQLDRGFRPAIPTMLRAVPRPGRNETCPCRSGKKYKYCCANREASRGA
jgi:hypothetical protein